MHRATGAVAREYHPGADRQIYEFGAYGGAVTDFVARLGSRALVPGEVRSAWGVGEYAGLLASRDDLDRRVGEIAHEQARALRRVEPDRVRSLLTALAEPPSVELNQARLARAAGIPPTTIAPYIDVLVRLGVIRLLPASRAVVTKRAIAWPRSLFADLPLAARLAEVDTEELSAFSGRSRLAPFLRALVCLELLGQQGGSRVPHRIGHLRERNGLEVDLVVELDDQTVYGIEIRTASGVRPHQFDALEALAARAGPRFRAGVVLNTAPSGHRYRPGLWSLPISAIWDEEGPPSAIVRSG